MTISNEQLVEHMIARGALWSPEIIAAFRAIDRKNFVMEGDPMVTYRDAPLSIGYGQTISQPSTVALMLEWLAPLREENILDMGSGSGWTTALLGYIVGKGGRVDGVEIVPELVEYGRENLAKYQLPWVHIHKSREVYGYKQSAPYDRIIVSAAASNIPQELIDQLSDGGKMIIPIMNDIVVVMKSKTGEIDLRKQSGFSFVPLIEP